MCPFPQKRISSRLVSLLIKVAPPFKKLSPSVDFEKVKGEHYLFSFEDKDPRFTRLKPVLALRLFSKGLFPRSARKEKNVPLST